MSTYSLAGYAGMLSDTQRVRSYLEAMSRAIKPGSVVLDLGAGFGYFALAACQMGAARVYAVEPAESLALLPELAARNGFSDRIVCLRDFSTRIELPERVDVVVADIRGQLPMLNGSLQTLIDARDRLLAPGGTLIPWRDTLYVAPVDDRTLGTRTRAPWSAVSAESEATRQLALEPVTQLLANTQSSRTVDPGSLLAAPRAWAQIDYHQNRSPHVEGSPVELCIEQLGVVYGLAAWFEAELMPGVRYSSGPQSPRSVYGTAYLPLQEPLSVQPEDRLQTRISSNDLSTGYHMTWKTALVRQGKTVASFEQADFFAQPLSLERLKRSLPDHVPTLSTDAQIARQVLEAANARQPLGQIARRLCEAFPARFKSDAAALDRATQVLARYDG